MFSFEKSLAENGFFNPLNFRVNTLNFSSDHLAKFEHNKNPSLPFFWKEKNNEIEEVEKAFGKLKIFLACTRAFCLRSLNMALEKRES